MGQYEVRCEQPGFRTSVRAATVEAGTTTTVNLPMQVGGTKEVVTVEAATAQISYDSHSVQGVIQRESIEYLPLNGRSYMQLAKLEPGVTVASGSVSNSTRSSPSASLVRVTARSSASMVATSPITSMSAAAYPP